MIENITIAGVHTEVDEDLHKYVLKKIGNLDKYISFHAQKSVRIEVRLKENPSKDKTTRTCEVVIHLPHEIITTQESTLNIYAAVDIVEAKLKNQLMKYKTKHINSKIHRRWLKRRQEREN
jgi:putative sigma-54 modulation protein